MDSMNKLMQLVTPPEEPQYTGDEKSRAEVNKKLGVNLPEDYFELLKIYGAGQFCGWVNVFNPFIGADEPGWYLNLYDNIKDERRNYTYSPKSYASIKAMFKNAPTVKYYEEKQFAESGAAGEGYPFDFYPKEGGLIPWGNCEEAAVLYWKMNEGKWTIVVYGEDEYYYEYDMTMTEFLYDLLSKQITNPLFEDIFSGGELSSPSFVRLKDQEGIA